MYTVHVHVYIIQETLWSNHRDGPADTTTYTYVHMYMYMYMYMQLVYTTTVIYSVYDN